MTDYFLRAVDEPALQTALQAAGLYSAETGYVEASLTHGLDIVGVIVHPGTYDENGNQLTAPIVREGFHANLRLLSGDLPESLSSLVIHPVTPSVVWA